MRLRPGSMRSLHSGAWLTGSQKVWRVVRSGPVATTYQFKINSGVGSIVNRIPATASTNGPKNLSTNVAIPSLIAGNSGLYFLPDCVLVKEGKHCSDVAINTCTSRTRKRVSMKVPARFPATLCKLARPGNT